MRWNNVIKHFRQRNIVQNVSDEYVTDAET